MDVKCTLLTFNLLIKEKRLIISLLLKRIHIFAKGDAGVLGATDKEGGHAFRGGGGRQQL
jgi:hypothetical protein